MINNIAILFFASVVIIGCDSKTKLKEDGNENNVVSNFLSDVQSLEIDTNTNSIVAFKELAEGNGSRASQRRQTCDRYRGQVTWHRFR